MVMIRKGVTVMMPVQPLVAGKPNPMPRIDKATVARIDNDCPTLVMKHIAMDIFMVPIMARPADGFIPVVLSGDPVMCGTQ